MDDILNDLESNLSDKDATAFITTLNELNSLGVDFTNPILNKKGYLNWNTKYDTTGLNKYFGSNSSKFNYLGPTTWNRNLLLNRMQENFGTTGLSVGGTKIYFDGNSWTTSKPVQSTERITPVTPVTTTFTDTNYSNKKDRSVESKSKK
jgi:hypothetical protein